MVGLRELLTVVLGAALGVLLVAYPQVFVRIQTLGRMPHDTRGRYGEDAENPLWVRIVQLVGVACIVAALYVATQSF